MIEKNHAMVITSIVPFLIDCKMHDVPTFILFNICVNLRFKIPYGQEGSIHALQVCEASTHIIYIQHSYGKYTFIVIFDMFVLSYL